MELAKEKRVYFVRKNFFKYFLTLSQCIEYWINFQNIYTYFCISKITSYTLFYKQRFFSTQSQCCFIFSWIEFQTLFRFRCYWVYISILMLRHSLNLLLCLDLGLLMSYLCDLFFIFIFIFKTINRIISC